MVEGLKLLPYNLQSLELQLDNNNLGNSDNLKLLGDEKK